MTKKEKESLAEGIAELKGNIDKAFSAENEVSDKLMVLFNEASEKGDVELARRLGEIIVKDLWEITLGLLGANRQAIALKRVSSL